MTNKIYHQKAYLHVQRIIYLLTLVKYAQKAVNSQQSGTTSITRPFTAYGKPDIPDKIIKGLGQGNRAVVNNPAGSLRAMVVDQHENPISNAGLTFTALPAESMNPEIPLPNGYRNIQFYKREECGNPYPLYNDCTIRAPITQTTQYFGGIVWTMLGNTVNTKYTVKVTASVLPSDKYVQFNLYSIGFRESAYSYLATGLYMGYIEPVNDKGQWINASKAGTQLKAPLTSALFMYTDEYTTEGPYTCSVNNQQTNCWKIKPSGIINTIRITNGTVIFTPIQGGGSVTPTQITNGLYSTKHTTGIQPAVNKIEAEGQATITVSEIFYDPDTEEYFALAQTPAQRTVTLKSGQTVLFDKDTQQAIIPVTIPPTQKLEYTVYGVLPEIKAIEPGAIMIDKDGYAVKDTNINYTIKPNEYNAIDAEVDIYEREPGSTNPDDDSWLDWFPGNAAQGDGTATIFQGTYFDITKEYYAEVVLNWGSDVEVKSEKVKLAIYKVNILSADVTQDRIQIELAPSGLTGTLKIELIGDNTHLIRNETRASGTYNETFDIPNLAEGKYTQVRATWTVDGISVPALYLFPVGDRMHVLGDYLHTRYNTPTESYCTGTNTPFNYTSGGCVNVQCNWNHGEGLSGWIDEVEENGSGFSNTLEFVSLEWVCPNTGTNLRQVPNPCSKCGGTLTVGVSVARNPSNENLPCGTKVYVYGVGPVTVQDAGGGLALDQLDHYAGISGCDETAGTIGRRKTIKLY